MCEKQSLVDLRCPAPTFSAFFTTALSSAAESTRLLSFHFRSREEYEERSVEEELGGTQLVSHFFVVVVCLFCKAR